jgi:hypothetical protein
LIDKSRLTISYEMGGSSGIIDGQLEDDEWVRLRIRYGPGRPDGSYYDMMEMLSAHDSK